MNATPSPNGTHPAAHSNGNPTGHPSPDPSPEVDPIASDLARDLKLRTSELLAELDACLSRIALNQARHVETLIDDPDTDSKLLERECRQLVSLVRILRRPRLNGSQPLVEYKYQPSGEPFPFLNPHGVILPEARSAASPLSRGERRAHERAEERVSQRLGLRPEQIRRAQLNGTRPNGAAARYLRLGRSHLLPPEPNAE